MSRYTPTTDEVRGWYSETMNAKTVNPIDYEEAEARFDRWKAENDRQVAEKAWDEGFAHSVRTNFHSRMPRLEDNPYRKGQNDE